MAVDLAQLRSEGARVPLATDLPLDSRTIESLGLPREIDRRDLLAFLSGQSARLASLVEPPMFRSLESDLGEPEAPNGAVPEGLSEEERELLFRWMGEVTGGDLATFDEDAVGDALKGLAERLDQLTKDVVARREAEEAHEEDDDADGPTDPSLPLPGAPEDDFNKYFETTVFKQELDALAEFPYAEWQKYLRSLKGDPVPLLLAIMAFVESRSATAFKALGQDQIRLNDRLAAASDLALQIPKLTKDNPTQTQAMTQRLNITLASLGSTSQINFMRIREHLTSISQIEQTMSAIKNIYHQTQIQGIIRRMTSN